MKLAPSTIGTTATDKSDGDHELMAGKDAVITDEVKYEGLIPGKEYTLHATLMDKKTGEPLKVADKGVTAELKFTPTVRAARSPSTSASSMQPPSTVIHWLSSRS